MFEIAGGIILAVVFFACLPMIIGGGIALLSIGLVVFLIWAVFAYWHDVLPLLILLVSVFVPYAISVWAKMRYPLYQAVLVGMHPYNTRKYSLVRFSNSCGLLFGGVIIGVISLYWMGDIKIAGAMIPLTFIASLFLLAKLIDENDIERKKILIELNRESYVNYFSDRLFALIEEMVDAKRSTLKNKTKIFDFEDENFSAKVAIAKWPFKEVGKKDICVKIKIKKDKRFLSNSRTLFYDQKFLTSSDIAFFESKERFMEYEKFMKSLIRALEGKFV